MSLASLRSYSHFWPTKVMVSALALAWSLPVICMDCKLVDVCHFLIVIGYSWLLLACYPFHCFSACMSVPMHFLAFLCITQLLLAGSCTCVPIASSVFHCMRRFLCMICPRILCVSHHDSKLVDVCYFWTVLDSSWHFLACYPFHCCSTCMSVPVHDLSTHHVPLLYRVCIYAHYVSHMC